MSKYHKKDVKEMSIQELEEYIKKNSFYQYNSQKKINPLNFQITDETISNNVNYQLSQRNYNEEIQKLLNENQELKNDLNQLFFFTDQNKTQLEFKIKELLDENFNLKQQINELKSKILLQQNILSNSEIDKNEIINEKKIMQDKYENEISELNTQLNNYKLKISSLNIEYQNLLENFHKLKQDLIFQNISQKNNLIEKENKQSTIEEVRNLKECLLTNNSNILEIKKRLNNIEKITIPELSKSTKSLKKSNSINNNKSNINSNSFNTKPINKTLSRNNFKTKQNEIKKNASLKKKTKKNSISPKKNINKSFNLSFHNDTNNSEQLIDEEIFSLERKVADLNISYQNFLLKLKQVKNFNESQRLKKNLKFLQETISINNNKLKELKKKQQIFLINSAMDIY